MALVQRVAVVADHFESKAAYLCEARACGRDDHRIKPLRIDLDEVDGLRCPTEDRLERDRRHSARLGYLPGVG